MQQRASLSAMEYLSLMQVFGAVVDPFIVSDHQSVTYDSEERREHSDGSSLDL